MAQYIPKSALVAEIERRMKLRYDSYKTYNSLSDFIAWEELEYFKEEFLPALEVKKVDIEKEVNEHWDEWAKEDGLHSIDFAKHFFELGMAVSNKTQKENKPKKGL